MQNKVPIQGFPYTEEDVHGVHQDISREHLQGVVYIMASLTRIFEENKTIRVKKND